jgi:hypothetical protein
VTQGEGRGFYKEGLLYEKELMRTIFFSIYEKIDIHKYTVEGR